MTTFYVYNEETEKCEAVEIECDGETEREHPYHGEKISFQSIVNKFDVEEVANVNYCNDFQTKIPQAGALYTGIHFQFTSGGYCSVFDLTNNRKLGEFALDGIVEGNAESSPHCNAACFSNVFYEQNDEFPLLYLNAYNSENLPLGTCYVHRIIRDGDNFSTVLIQTITVGFAEKKTDGIWADYTDKRPYGNFVIDTDNGHLYAYTLRDGLQVTRFFKFKLPAIFDSNGAVIATVTLEEADILDKFDCEYFPVIQDSEYYQGKIYLCSGDTSTLANDPSIRVVDLAKKVQVSHIRLLELGESVWRREPESLVIYEGSILMTTLGKLTVPPKAHRFYF